MRGNDGLKKLETKSIWPKNSQSFHIFCFWPERFLRCDDAVKTHNQKVTTRVTTQYSDFL